MSPFISIIIPVYNVELYLHECLDSVVGQTLREVEIICVNDCSTDGSLAILREYEAKDSRIIVIDKPVNEGLSTTRNIGMAVATGRYMLFIDSDDYVDTDLCRKVFDCAEKNQADLVLYDYAGFWTNDELEKNRRKDSTLGKVSPFDKTGLLALQAYAWTKLIRTSHSRALSLRFPDGLLYEDIPVHWALITLTERIALLPEQLCFYRQHNASIGYRTDWKRTDYVLVYDLVRDFLIHHNIYDTYRTYFLCQELKNFYILHDTIDPAHKHDVMELVIERMTSAHWQYIGSTGVFNWKVRDFFLAFRGSYFAKIRRTLWLFIRSIYRKIMRSY